MSSALQQAVDQPFAREKGSTKCPPADCPMAHNRHAAEEGRMPCRPMNRAPMRIGAFIPAGHTGWPISPTSPHCKPRVGLNREE